MPPRNTPLSRKFAPEPDADPNLEANAISELVPAELLKDSLGYAIKRTQVRCIEALYAVLPPDLSPTRMSALSTIGANPGISQSALGEVLHIAPPSVVKVVDILERIGLVERRAAKTDRRIYALVLTDAGEDELKRCRTLVASYERDISSKLSATERRQLIELLSRVAI
ncbi:MAG: MarR family transcriptional regulator [Burkholderiaceae bacterium]|nr:MarR family transcriptional regulator [Burkholderiaceae bacterium]